MLEKIGIILGLVLSALALASAFENFSNVGLLWKLVVTAVAGLIMSQVVANWLAKWTNPSEQFPGFGRPPAGRSTGRFCFSLVLLGALCGAFVGLSLLLIQWFTLQLHETKTVEKSITLLIAPYSRVEGITIQLPSKNDSKCAWTDKEPKSFPRLNIQMIDWDSMTPKLHIDQFSYPQRIMVDCSP